MSRRRCWQRPRRGDWPAALWRAVDEAGYLDVLAEGPGGMVEAVAILRAAGHHAAPIPLPETMLARWLCAASGIDAPAGPLSIALAEPDDSRRDTRPCRGAAAAEAVAICCPGRRCASPSATGCASSPAQPRGRAARRADRDRRRAARRRCRTRSPPSSVRGVGALMRAAQMAGAMEAALDLATTYANDRVQFGRPIGKFQAIQQQLALLAEEAAAALVAVESAAISRRRGAPSAEFAIPAAKIRAGEAAGTVAEIAHQVHGAIGFTEEHSPALPDPPPVVVARRVRRRSLLGRLLGRRIAAAGGAGLWPLITMNY